MRRSSWLPFAGLIGLLVVGGPSAVVHAHEGDAGITLDPDQVTAGGTVLLAGAGLEPDDSRVLVLRGEDIVVSLGSATTDADGMLAQEVTIPGHLPTGSYQLQAIGDETLQTELKVQAAAGTPESVTVVSDPVITAPSTSERLVVIVGAFILAVLGLVLIRRAERFGRLPTA
jgi:hypothetical protein